MRLPKNILEYIEKEAEQIHHGRIILELNDTLDKVDIIVENRERFSKEKNEDREIEEKNEIRNG